MSRPPHWSVEPKGLIPAHKKTEENRGSQLKEGRTYYAHFVNRPGSVTETAHGTQIYSEKGVRELGHNVLAEVYRGAMSQVCRPLKAKVTPVAAGGDTGWKTSRAARALGPVIDGVFNAVNFRRKAARAVEDGMSCVEGFILWEDDPLSGKRVAVNLNPFQTFISSTRDEATTCRPRSRRWLKAVYASGTTAKDMDLRALIDALPDYKVEPITGVTAVDAFSSEDLVAVHEGWLEPIGDGKVAPGRHVVALSESLIVVDEVWNNPLPIADFQWEFGLEGEADGKPLGRTLAPLHIMENEYERKIADALAGVVPWVVGPENISMPSDVPYQHIKIEDGQTADSVKVVVPNSVSPALRDAIKDHRETMHRAGGVSEEAAEGTAPAPIKSGIGLSLWISIVNQRLSQQHAAYQLLWIKSARINVALGPPKGKADDALSKQVDWERLQLPVTAYTLSFDVVSDLPNHLPFRLDLLEKLREQQAIDTGEMLAHIDDGDVSAVMTRLNAERNFIEHQISRALDDGTIEPPVPFQDKAKLAKSAQRAWMDARTQKSRPPRAHMDALWVLQRLAANASPTSMPPEPGLPTDPMAAPPPGAPNPAAPPPGAPTPQPLSTQLSPLPA